MEIETKCVNCGCSTPVDAPQTATVSDEAVQAAHAEYHKVLGDKGRSNPMLAALTAALPHFSVPCAVEVKKLEWKEGLQLDGRKQWHSDDKESISETHPSWIEQGYRLFFAGTTYPTLEQAQAAAQADFERRILSCVVTKPVDVAAVRGQTLEDAGNPVNYDHTEAMQVMVKCACKVCGGVGERNDADCGDMYFNTWVCDGCDGKGWDRQAYFEAFPTIRALSAEPAQGARTLEEWHEDHSNVVWWAWDNDRKEWLGEPAYIGKPLDSDWPDYHTHWTPHPAFPAAPTTEAGK